MRRESIKRLVVRAPNWIGDAVMCEPALRGLYVAEDMKQRTDHGAVGYPELASAAKGRKFLDAAIGRTVEVVEALLQRRLPS